MTIKPGMTLPPDLPEKTYIKSQPTRNQIISQLDEFKKRSAAAATLLGNNYKNKLEIVASGKGTGGAAKGEMVTVDVKDSLTGMFVTVQEAAESAIFEFNNAKNAPAYKQHKKALEKKDGGSISLWDYGMEMAYTEFESTVMVAKVLAEIGDRYTPSSFGQGQIDNVGKGKEDCAKLPHSTNPRLHAKFRLPTWELYAYEVIEKGPRANMLENMAKFEYIERKKNYTPKELFNSIRFGSKVSKYIHCVALLELLTKEKNKSRWKVAWRPSEQEWEFKPDMKQVAGVSNPQQQLRNIFEEFARDRNLIIKF